MVRKKFRGGVFTQFSHLKVLKLLLLLEDGCLKSPLAESRSSQLKQGLITHEGTHFKSTVVHARCDQIVEIPAFHHLWHHHHQFWHLFQWSRLQASVLGATLRKKKRNVLWKCVDIKRNLCVGEDDAHKQVWFPQIQIAFEKDGKVEEGKRKCSRQAGRKKEVRKSNIKEKAVSTRWSMPGESLQFLCRQQFPCQSLRDAGYSVLLPVRFQLDWDAYVWNRIPSSGQIFLQILVLECFYPATWRDGAFMVTSPHFLHSSELNPGLESGAFPLLQCV